MMQEEEYDSDTSDEDYKAEKEVHSSSSDLDSDAEGAQKNESLDQSVTETAEEKKIIKEQEAQLWSDFLNDVEETPKPKTEKVNKSKVDTTSIKKSSVNENQNKNGNSEKTVKITKIFEFAGEEVRVEKEVDADSAEAKSNTDLSPKVPTSSGIKRGGASGLLDLIQNKRAKLSTLEKTKLDWNSFKEAEGIDEELELHKKSKAGYLGKQEFLARADLKQFEIEKELRRKGRSKR